MYGKLKRRSHTQGRKAGLPNLCSTPEPLKRGEGVILYDAFSPALPEDQIALRLRSRCEPPAEYYASSGRRLQRRSLRSAAAICPKL
jgi:hypothetical protein